MTNQDKKLNYGFKLMKRSFMLLSSNEKLLTLPLASSLLDLVILAVILTPIRHYEALQQPLTQSQIEHISVLILLYMVFLYIAHLIFYFFNCALSKGAEDKINHKKPRLWASVGFACKRFWYVFLWVTFATTIGIFIATLQTKFRRFAWFNKIFVDQNWQTATFFMLPVLMHHNLTPLKAIQKSASLVQQTWGSSVSTRVKFAPALLVLMAICLIPIVIGFLLGGVMAHSIGAFVSLTLFLSVGIFYFTARMITTVILYRYANGHSVPNDFTPELMKNAFVKVTS